VILPSTYSGAILCLVFSMLCWGTWANLQKLTGKWRYELFYWDFSIGIALAGVVAAFTLGSLNSTELTFQDNLLIASYHRISYAVEGGALFNLANVLLVAALSVAPMAVVFPIAVGVAVVVESGWLLFPQQGSMVILLGGAVLVLSAIIVNAFTYSIYAQDQRAVKKALTPDPRTPTAAAARPPMPAKGVALSVVSGVVLGLVPPLADLSKSGDDGLGPYTAGLIFALAALGSTFLLAPFFVTFAVHGAPVQLRAYFKGSKSVHLSGILAGILWSVGLIATFASGGTLATIQAGPVAPRAFAYGAAVLATLCGLLGWREFRGGSHRVRMLLTAMLILWILGASLVTIAPVLAK
jgi:glucose uptake protein